MSSQPLKAGAAVRDISPRDSQFLCGYPHVERMSTGVHDPLLASALYLDNGRAGVLLLALDILFLDPPTARGLRAAVASQTGLPEACVFISCTHTHSAPITAVNIAWASDPVVPRPDPAYLAFLKVRALEAAAEARQQARPAELAWTAADAAGVGGNRLAKGGLTDAEAGILAIREASGGAWLAFALIYGMHPTVLHEDSKLASADFPGYTRLHLQEIFGKSVPVLYHSAPCGNQSPRYFVTGQTFGEAERLGRKLGDSAATRIRELTAFTSAVPLAGGLGQVTLPRRQLPSLEEAQRALAARHADYERLKKDRAGHGPVRTAECAIFGAEETVALSQAQQSGAIDAALAGYIPADVQALRIGEACVAGLPGECFVEYALAIKKRAPRKTFVVSLVNGELQGYIVTPEAAAAGGYEAANSLFLPESGALLVNEALAMVEKLEN
ncbi:MAG: hypothetical protein HY343_01215 [Lentisphaerae bacterium]|nr:hypothetical protein [Lentisphaerota bacterium]